MFRIPTTPKIKPFVSIDGVEIDIENTPPGSITLEQYRNVRANSPGFDILYIKLNNEALIEAVRHNLKNCSPQPSIIYEGALQNILVPELLKRLAGKGSVETGEAYVLGADISDRPAYATISTQCSRCGHWLSNRSTFWLVEDKLICQDCHSHGVKP